MNKVLLIIQREYLVRVKKKSFIVMTFLVPGLIILMYGIIILIAMNSDDLTKDRTVKVIDQSGAFIGKFHNIKKMKFENASESLTAEKADLKKHEENMVLFIPQHFDKKDSLQVFSKSKPSYTITGEIEKQINDIALGNSLVKAGIDTSKLHNIKSQLTVSSKEVTDTGDQDANLGAAYGAGIGGAILIYLSIFIYGAQVMRGVIEEKTSRVVEVIISSVKPFQLMLGKIIGVGMVGLTQFLLWIVFTTVISFIAGHFFTIPPSPVMNFVKSLSSINAAYEVTCFMFYWLSGFLLYSALFAAVGSAVDSETETQQFMFPITMPLLFTYLLSVSYLFQAPDSPLAFWLSIIPLSAPVAMMVRLPFHVPAWQLGLSMFMMIVGFLFTTWVASRIYRVGILMYGKKVNFKELSKWFFYKE